VATQGNSRGKRGTPLHILNRVPDGLVHELFKQGFEEFQNRRALPAIIPSEPIFQPLELVSENNEKISADFIQSVFHNSDVENDSFYQQCDTLDNELSDIFNNIADYKAHSSLQLSDEEIWQIDENINNSGHARAYTAPSPENQVSSIKSIARTMFELLRPGVPLPNRLAGASVIPLGHIDKFEHSGPNQWSSFLQSVALNSEQFTAGSYHKHSYAWDELIKIESEINRNGSMTKQQKKVIGIVSKGGYMTTFRSTQHCKSEGFPRLSERLKYSTQVLAKAGYSEEDIHVALHEDYPPSMSFENHNSALKHKDFMTSEIKRNLLSGSIVEWNNLFPDEEPHVVIPIHVAERDYDGKLRMCTDNRYAIVWEKHESTSMDAIGSILNMFTSSNDLGATNDAFSGYHHLLKHPESIYWAFKWGSKLYAHPALSFGEKNSAFAFCETRLVNKHCVQSLGFTLRDYVDDETIKLSNISFNTALKAIFLYILLESNLGHYFSFNKCNLWPSSQLNKVLGFNLDLKSRIISVPEVKLAKIAEELIKLSSKLYSGEMNALFILKQAQSMAGKLLSMSHAVIVAPLFARFFYNITREPEQWLKSAPPSILARAINWFAENISNYSSRSFDNHEIIFTLKGDASAIGAGAHEVVPSQGIQFFQHPFVFSFSEEWRQRMQINDPTLHSELRESWALSNSIKAAIAALPIGSCIGKTICYITDAQALYHDCASMSPRDVDVFKHVAEAYITAANAGAQLSVLWLPRTHLEQADYLSKMTDIGDMSISSDTLNEVVRSLKAQPISFDCFAAQHNAKCELFATRWLDANCQFVDIFSHGLDVQKHNCWMFPPFNLVLQTIQWIARYNISGILLVPITQGAPWWPLLSASEYCTSTDIPKSLLIFGARLPKTYSLPNMSHLRAFRITSFKTDR